MKCLECNGKIKMDDIWDEEVVNDDTLILHCIGFCEKCHSSYYFDKILKTTEEKIISKIEE